MNGWIILLFGFLLSVPAAFVLAGITGFSTPGWIFQYYFMERGLRDWNIVVAVAIDSTLWCVMVCGIRFFANGWAEFKIEKKHEQPDHYWAHSAQRSNAWLAATLCSTFLCYYVALSVALSFGSGVFHRLPSFAILLLLSFASCALGSYALNALLVVLIFGIKFN